ncbi:MAG TPA: hypothetical protein VJT75_11545, partial [Thermoleophilaceae bacterium]|nr:hypothetical protein [Thermoleophilaceae bacterium]
PRRTEPPASFRRPLAAAPVAAAAVAIAAVVLALSFGAPWLADRYLNQAEELWQTRPGRAFDKLDTAASLNPLSPLPDATAGAIALRLDRPRTAERYYRRAIDRDPNGGAAYLELGAIVYESGRRPEGLRLLRRASALQPRDEVTSRVLRRARRGGRIDIDAMNDALRRRTAKLGR